MFKTEKKSKIYDLHVQLNASEDFKISNMELSQDLIKELIFVIENIKEIFKDSIEEYRPKSKFLFTFCMKYEILVSEWFELNSSN